MALRKTIEGIPGQIHIDDTQEREGFLPGDMELAERVMSVLLRYYPNHPWDVWASHRQGVVVIKLPPLKDTLGVMALGSKYGMVLKIQDLKSDPGLRQVVRFGGELLERWGIPRGAYRGRDYAEARPQFSDKRMLGVKNLPTHIRKPLEHATGLVDQHGRPLKRTA